MSLRLVDNVTALPVAGLRGVAASARAFADAVDAGKVSPERCIIVAIVDGAIDYCAWGDPPSVVEAIGVLEMASRNLR